MSTPNHAAHHHEEENYLTHDTSIQSWLLTKDHKRIALLYFLSVTLFFTIGGLFASLVRIELLTPAGDFMSAELYNQAFTSHGVMMIFFFLIPAVPAVLGNFLVPLMVGAKDLAFPRINLASWYIFMVGASLAVFEDFEIEWAKGFGVANAETKKPVDTLTLFQAASISKPVAALAVLRHQKRRLSRDVSYTRLPSMKIVFTRVALPFTRVSFAIIAGLAAA